MHKRNEADCTDEVGAEFAISWHMNPNHKRKTSDAVYDIPGRIKSHLIFVVGRTRNISTSILDDISTPVQCKNKRGELLQLSLIHQLCMPEELMNSRTTTNGDIVSFFIVIK